MKNKIVNDGNKIFNLLGKEKWKYLLSVIICAIVVPAFELTLPWVTKWMINAVEIGSKELLIQGFSTMIIIFILYSVLVPITAYHFEGRSHKPLLGVRLNLLKHIIGLPFNFFSQQHSGELMSRLTGDIDELFDFYKEQTYDIISILVKGIGALVMLLMLDIRIAIPVIVLGILSALSRSYMIKSLKDNSDDVRKLSGEANSLVTDSLGGIKVVKAFKFEKSLLKNFASIMDKATRKAYDRNLIDIKRDVLSYIISTLNFFGVLCIGAYMISTGTLDVGSVFAAIMLQEGIIEMFVTFGNYGFGIKIQLAKSARIFELFDEMKEETGEYEGSDSYICNDELITIKDGRFSYNDREAILLKINIRIMRNEFVILEGQSGAGKSTLSKILTGLMPLESGNILWCGKVANMAVLRNNVAYVSQEPYLFKGTILDNLKIGNPKATMEEIYETTKKACAHDFIARQPQGYNTLIGERGLTLSGGQRQRIAIARALLKEASILLIDEGTSAIDSEIENILLDNLISEVNRRTVIFVAHRPTIAKRANRVISMGKGIIKAC
ncbi:ABC transporter ATP-binding protein [Clostridium sp. D2Q-11]|uniref:ABC transporter ATP-binding protein n=1 Tax=Anaeromonas frigoriresistens TaxID=2683708 RepID=A0A942Z965_9FIRM|nr:ABC transporter ATP-binding protein [Anaeromonas frigoriresistens]MBS4539003.1 ABC transporter ATP-binding protein [Anaeromonas frigoriresistens]